MDWSESAFPPSETVSSRAAFSNYHGVPLPLLVTTVRRFNDRPKIWLAGDSSLDNKHWLFRSENKWDRAEYATPACNGYETVLTDPGGCVRDVCFWLNRTCVDRGSPYVAVNTAVEATTLQDRGSGRTLLGQDLLIRDHMRPEDVLIVSIGGNDIALRPGLRTMLSVGWLALFAGEDAARNGTAFGFSQLRNLFYDQVGGYVRALCGKVRPRKVLVCMIYYPCEGGEGWADPLLNLLGYNAANKPRVSKIQGLLDAAFAEFTCKIAVEGTEVVPVALGKVLDSKNPLHYENRVEPSIEGGRLMAEAFVEMIHQVK